MALPKRSARLPKALRAELQIPRGERLLGTTRSRSGGWAIATRSNLYVIDGQHATQAPWWTISHGKLDAETSNLIVEWLEDREPLVIELLPEESRTFAVAFRQQVDSSVVHVVYVDMPDGQYARVVIRRDADGALFSVVEGEFDSSEQSLAAVGTAERRARMDAGLPAENF